MKRHQHLTSFIKIALIIIFITILPYSIVGFQDSIFAQEPNKQLLKVSPYIFTVRLSPEKEYSYELTIENLQDFPVPIHIETEDFVIQDESGDYAFEKNNENSLVSWLDIPTRDMILAPREIKQLEFTVTTPSKIPFGGYHGMIFLEPRTSTVDKNSSVLNTRIGIPVIASIGSTAYQVNPLRILEYSIPQLITNKDQLQYSLRVQNNSLFHTTARPILNLKPFWGEQIKLFLDEKLLFPGKIRAWEGSISENERLIPNVYSTTLNLPIGNGNSIAQNSHLIYIPISYMLTIALLLLLAVVYILHRQRKIHIGRFLKTLIKG